MKICELFTSGTHKTKIHSLNLSNNNIGKKSDVKLCFLNNIRNSKDNTFIPPE